MLSFSGSQKFRSIISKVFLLGLILSLPGSSEAQTQIFKGNNGNALDQGNSWVGGVVPNSGNIIVYNNSNTPSTTGTIGSGLGVAGILFSTNPSNNISISNAVGGTGILGLGASGIDIRASTNRTLTISAPISLNADQNWYTGLTNANTAMINANGLISGTARLSIGGASNSSNQYVLFATNNTFSGGLILNAGGAVKVGSTAALVAGSVVQSNSLGIGMLTINGGTIFGGSGQVAFPGISVNNDFSINSGTSSVSARLTLAGGTMNLGGATRTISLGRWTNITATNGALTGGFESLKLSYASGYPNLIITNGTVRFVRGAGATPSDYVSVNFGGTASGLGTSFSSGSGMVIGTNVFVTFSGGSSFAGGSSPNINIEAGGYLNLGGLAGAQDIGPIRTLTGQGIVTCIATNTNSNTPKLTLSPSSGDVGDFPGSILDGSQLNSVLGTSSTNTVIVSVVKSGAGTQILSGSNNYSGTTLINTNGGELRFARRVSLYAGNSALWNKISVSNGAILGLNLSGSDPFTAVDFQALASDSNNSMKAGAYFGVAVSSLDYPSSLSTNLYYVNAANPGGIGLAKSGNGNLTLTGLPASNSVPLLITGGKVTLGGVSTFAGSPVISGGGILDLGGAIFPIPNSLTLTDGSIVNFNPGVADPFAPTSNVSYTGFSFAVNRLNDGTNGVRTFTLTNSVLTVGGEVATNGFTISGASNGVMRFTGSTTGQGDTNTRKGQISIQGSAFLEFASNSLFDSYRPLSINSASNPTVLVSGGTISNLSYVIFGSASANTGTLRITSGSLSMANPNPDNNGLYFGQNGGAGTLSLEGGEVSTPTIKVQSGSATINLAGGTLNIVTTNTSGNPASATQLTTGGTLNFYMTGGSLIATNSKLNLSSANASNSFTTTFTQNGGLINSVEMSAGPGTFVMNGGTNVSAAGMYVGDNTNGLATFTQNGGLVQILGQSGSVAANDLVIGSASGNGTYTLNGGVLEVFGKIRKNSGTSSLILNGGAIRYTNSTNQTAFISSLVDTTVGSNGAIFEITDSNVTNSIQAALNNASGQVGKLVKRGAGTLAIGRENLGYSGSTKVEGGTLSVSDTTAGYVARITRDQVVMEFASAPAGPVSTFQILPSSLQDGTTSISATGLGANQQINFDPSTSIATVVTDAVQSNPYELWSQGSPLTSETLLRYALGGASSPSANDGQPTTVRRSGNDLVLSLVLRTNDLALRYQPQISGDLTPNSWTNTNAPYTLPISQGVPANFERREYSVPATNPRLFLRIQVTK